MTFLLGRKKKNRYYLHKNTATDLGYLQFLAPVVSKVSSLAPSKAQGLDFGCGHTTVLKNILETSGFEMSVYDPFFFTNKPDGKKFDFVTCTEVVEHFHSPKETFDYLFSLIKPNGFILIMTELYSSNTQFDEWHYVRDLTHVSFYTDATFEWLATQYSKVLTVENNRVVTLQ